MVTRHWHELPNAPAPGTALVPMRALVDGQATLHTLDGSTPPFRLLLLRSGDQVRAYVNRCAHFGVPLAERQDLLIFQAHQSLSCNVHYARYHWEDGRCLSGECEGESLLPVPLQIGADGQLQIGAVAPA